MQVTFWPSFFSTAVLGVFLSCSVSHDTYLTFCLWSVLSSRTLKSGQRTSCRLSVCLHAIVKWEQLPTALFFMIAVESIKIWGQCMVNLYENGQVHGRTCKAETSQKKGRKKTPTRCQNLRVQWHFKKRYAVCWHGAGVGNSRRESTIWETSRNTELQTWVLIHGGIGG